MLNRRSLLSKVKYIVFIALFTLLACEILLRLFKVNRTYSEESGEGYATYYNQVLKTWYYVWPKDTTFILDHGDFKYPFKTNSLGLREREFIFNRPDAKHIICIGDSYTEGVGAPYDSSFPHLLQNHLNETGVKAEVLDAGVSGSDPFFEFVLYKYKLLPCKAQYLFICINSTDIDDYIFRGGLERFRPDGKTVFAKGPWFEHLYKYSYAARYWVNNVLGYPRGNLFIKDTVQLKLLSKQAGNNITNLMDSLQQLTTANRCKLLVILQPQILELAGRNGEINGRTEKLFNSMQDKLESNHIDVVNLWGPLSPCFTDKNFMSFTYQHDRHYNGAGYDILSLKLMEEINKKYPDFYATPTLFSGNN